MTTGKITGITIGSTLIGITLTYLITRNYYKNLQKEIARKVNLMMTMAAKAADEGDIEEVRSILIG